MKIYIERLLCSLIECNTKPNHKYNWLANDIITSLRDQGLIYKEGQIFPELAESEDERIRKALTDYFKWNPNGQLLNEFSNREVFAWLEKQGEKKSINNLTQQEAMDIAVAKCFEESEQKPVDKVEPKFNTGEWITNGDYTWKIVEVKPLDYILQSQDGNIVDDTISHVDEQFHSFTIKDAKPGDVLVASDKSLFIYDGSINENGSVGFHIAFAKDTDIILNSDDGCGWEEKDSCHPATKEQRDLLFQKMKESGYEWDADQKKLEKIKKAPQEFMVGDTIRYNGIEYKITEITPIGYKVYAPIYDEDTASFISFGAPAILVEQKSAWSEEDEAMWAEISDLLWEGYKQSGSKFSWDDIRNWVNPKLKSLKGRVLPQPKQEWSEEDKRKIDRIYYILFQAADTHAFSTTCRLIGDKECVELQDFLKSLLPQNRWKPSDEQMEALKQAKTDACGKPYFNALASLYVNLKGY